MELIKNSISVVDRLNSEKFRINAEILKNGEDIALKIGSLMLPILGLASAKSICKELQENGTVCLSQATAYNEGLYCSFSLYFTGRTFYIVMYRDYPSGLDTREVYYVYPDYLTGDEIIEDFEDSLAKMFEREIDTSEFRINTLW